MRRLAAAALVFAIFGGAAACGSDGGPEIVAPEVPAKPFVHVVVGASDSVGEGARFPGREAWPRVLTETTFPVGTVLEVVGQPGATVSTALKRQVAGAVALKPDVFTVWLAVNDLVRFVPVAGYERDLDALIASLRSTGATVLIGNVPLALIERFIANQQYWRWEEGSRPGDVYRDLAVSYNAAIARVAAKHGAVLVDLDAAAKAFAGDPLRLFGRDRFHPSTEGHRMIAAAFADVWTGPRRPKSAIPRSTTTSTTARTSVHGGTGTGTGAGIPFD